MAWGAVDFPCVVVLAGIGDTLTMFPRAQRRCGWRRHGVMPAIDPAPPPHDGFGCDAIARRRWSGRQRGRATAIDSNTSYARPTSATAWASEPYTSGIRRALAAATTAGGG